MDKAERVAEEALQSVSYRVSRAGNRDRVAAILRREYGDVRREALEEAWRTFCPECKARIPPKGRCGYVSESGGEQAIASLAICPLLRAAKEAA